MLVLIVDGSCQRAAALGLARAGGIFTGLARPRDERMRASMDPLGQRLSEGKALFNAHRCSKDLINTASQRDMISTGRVTSACIRMLQHLAGSR